MDKVSLYDYDLADTLVLPAPPPAPAAPGAEAALQRSTSYASSFTLSDQPSIEALRQQTLAANVLLSSILSDFTSIKSLRNLIIHHPTSPSQLSELARLTTSTGTKILALWADLSDLQSQSENLDYRGEDGKSTLEIARVVQGIGALKEKAREAREEVKVEVQQEREGRRERMEIVIRRENPEMDHESVSSMLDQAISASAILALEADITSYAGRLAIEAPFLEFARLLDSVKGSSSDDRRSDILSSGSTRSARTLVSQASTYDKFDADEDLEHAPLTQPDGVASFTIEENDGWRPTHDRSTSRVERRKQWIIKGGAAACILIFLISMVTLDVLHQGETTNGTPTGRAPVPSPLW